MFRVKVDFGTYTYETEVLNVKVKEDYAKFLIWNEIEGEFQVVDSFNCEFIKDAIIY